MTEKQNNKEDQGSNPFEDAEVIFQYTRRQAIEDGVLVDVSEMAREAGIRCPMAVTERVWSEVITPSERAKQEGCGMCCACCAWQFKQRAYMGIPSTLKCLSETEGE